MRARLAVLLFGLAGLLSGPKPPAAQAVVADTIITFRGLVAFDLESGRAIFLSPSSDPHTPTMVFDLSKLEDGSGLPADVVAARSDGVGLAIWKFKEVELNRANIVEAKLDFNDGEVTGNAPDNDPRIRWIPKMSDIFHDKQVLDDTEVKGAAARGTFPVGRLTPVFDRASTRTTRYDLGFRKCTAIADALRMRVKVKDPTKPLLKLTTSSKTADFVIEPGTWIEFAAFPMTKGTDFAHLPHLLKLRKGNKEDRPVRKCEGASEPGVRPIRCAPVEFP